MKGFQLMQNGWRIVGEQERLLITHFFTHPFITLLKREKVYTANRGTVKETIVEKASYPLTEWEEKENALILKGSGHSVDISCERVLTGIRFIIRGEEGYAYRIRLPFAREEAVFGGGEQYRQLNLRGEQVVNFVSEHIKARTVFEKALLPKRTYRERSHSEIGTYAPMPIFVTDANRLIWFDVDSDGTSEFGDDCTFTFDACPRSLTILFGTSFRDLGEQLVKLIPNRMGVPDWCQDGMILGIQGGTRAVLRKTKAMLKAGAKIAGVWSQDWSGENRTVMGKQVWWNWETDTNLYPDLENAIRSLRDMGVRFLAYINPYLVKDSKLYEYCRKQGYLIRRPNGTVYHIRSTTFDAGMLDLTNPDAVRYIKEVLIKQNMLDLGISGWMADFGEYLPVDCVLYDGDPKKLHNVWPVLWAKINREAIEEYGAEDAMFFMRSGYVGVQSYAPILWNGDQHTDLTKDYGMPCVMPASFNAGFSGVTWIHSDIGGFFSFGKLRRDEELFTRWMEMCAFTPMMRSHESLRPWANAQFDAPAVIPYTVKMTNVFAKLKPYRLHVMEDAKKGIQALRPDFWFSGKLKDRKDPYSFFFGDDLYVCPVIERRKNKRTVHLPEGNWIHLWSGKEYGGNSRHSVDAPLGEIPVFYRKESSFAELFRSIWDKQ